MPKTPMAMTLDGRWLLLLLLLASLTPAAQARDCSGDCRSMDCISEWWKNSQSLVLASAAVLVFFATFLPRVLVRLVIFVLTKVPFMRQYVVHRLSSVSLGLWWFSIV